MIPRRIEIYNLGTIPYADIDLTNVSLAGIAGPNGAGKSTGFTIAPMFALFGTTKNGCSVDDMVRTGTTEMAVHFEFEYREEIYRVSRGRSTKGKGKSTLELQRNVSGQWEPESGTTIRETQEKIQALLNLDADTFISTSMILQGRANEFTSKPPGQRKAVLVKALGLEQYDRLQEKAKEKVVETKTKLETAKNKVAELDARLKARDNLKLALKSTKSKLLGVENDIKAKEGELAETEQQVQDLEVKALKATEIEQQIDRVNGELTKSRELRDLHQKRLDSANKMLNQKENILSKAGEYEETKEKVTILQAKRPRLDELSKEQDRIESELSRLSEEIRRIGVQIKPLEDALANRSNLQKASVQYKESLNELQNMDALQDKYYSLDSKYREAKDRYNQEQSYFDVKTRDIQSRMQVLREKTVMLNDSGCIDPQNATCNFLADAQQAKAKLSEAEAEYNRHMKQGDLTKTSEEVESLRNERDSVGYNPEEHRQLKDLVSELRPKAEQAAQLESKAEQVEILQQNRENARDRMVDHNTQLNNVKQSAQLLTMELGPLTSMEAKLPNLKKWAEAKEKLPAARQAATAATENLKFTTEAIKSSEVHLKQLEVEHKQLSLKSAGLDAAKENKRNLQGYIATLREKQNDLHSQVGGLKSQLDALKADAEERRELAKKIEPMARELIRWQKLVKAFGRDGIPALIIENAVPELERISNEILGQMSNGKHSVRFDTQRELKSQKGAVTETLDIMVGDWSGERPYETFSGGEQLRIDFATRFALAELLARRAGSRVEWLTIDEGLGSQDAKHRALVLEAIKAVADRFRVTLVITHIEEAQAVFEQHIYFEPQESGVEVTVA